VQRCNLASVLLLLKSSGIDDVLKFEFMDPPPRQALISALEQLYALQCLDNSGKLTDIGKQMSLFPLDPPFAKLILFSQV
jgi:HrpA-like RNA helicase